MKNRQGIRAFLPIAVLNRANGQTYQARDISSTGVFLLDTAIELNASLDLLLTHEQNSVEGVFKAVRKTQDGIGMELQTASAKQTMHDFMLSVCQAGAELDERRMAPRMTTNHSIQWRHRNLSHFALLIELSRRGAVIEGDILPDNDNEITVVLSALGQHRQAGSASAQVVRHIGSRKAAIEWQQPSEAFLELVGKIRRSTLAAAST